PLSLPGSAPLKGRYRPPPSLGELAVCRGHGLARHGGCVPPPARTWPFSRRAARAPAGSERPPSWLASPTEARARPTERTSAPLGAEPLEVGGWVCVRWASGLWLGLRLGLGYG